MNRAELKALHGERVLGEAEPPKHPYKECPYLRAHCEHYWSLGRNPYYCPGI